MGPLDGLPVVPPPILARFRADRGQLGIHIAGLTLSSETKPAGGICRRKASQVQTTKGASSRALEETIPPARPKPRGAGQILTLRLRRTADGTAAQWTPSGPSGAVSASSAGLPPASRLR